MKIDSPSSPGFRLHVSNKTGIGCMTHCALSVVGSWLLVLHTISYSRMHQAQYTIRWESHAKSGPCFFMFWHHSSGAVGPTTGAVKHLCSREAPRIQGCWGGQASSDTIRGRACEHPAGAIRISHSAHRHWMLIPHIHNVLSVPSMSL